MPGKNPGTIGYGTNKKPGPDLIHERGIFGFSEYDNPLVDNKGQ